MSKNLIKQPAIRAALVASGSLQPSATETAKRCILSLQESQAAAIAARRKELGVKPVISNKTMAMASKLAAITKELP